MDGLIQQNSLLISLLAGNLVQRPVRNGLHRQPCSRVSVGYVRVTEFRKASVEQITGAGQGCATRSGSATDRGRCSYPNFVWPAPPLRSEMIFGKHRVDLTKMGRVGMW